MAKQRRRTVLTVPDTKTAPETKQHGITVLEITSEGKRGGTGLSETLRVHGVNTDGPRHIRRGKTLRVINNDRWTPRARTAVLAFCKVIAEEDAAVETVAA